MRSNKAASSSYNNNTVNRCELRHVIRCLFFFFGRSPSSRLVLFSHILLAQIVSTTIILPVIFSSGWFFLLLFISIWLRLRDAVTIYLDNRKRFFPPDWFQPQKTTTTANTRKNHSIKHNLFGCWFAFFGWRHNFARKLILIPIVIIKWNSHIKIQY